LKYCGKERGIDPRWGERGMKERKLGSYLFKVFWLVTVGRHGKRMAEESQFRTLCMIKYNIFTF
jgi:hypothetical protein